jgi:hypothetical protein
MLTIEHEAELEPPAAGGPGVQGLNSFSADPGRAETKHWCGSAQGVQGVHAY